MHSRGRVLLALAAAELLAMALWFSASAVVPQLAAEWGLAAGRQSWLTMSVQLGFVAGALGAAITNVADRIAAHRLFMASGIVGAVANGAIAVVRPGYGVVVLLRFVTGACLAGIYPPAMKLMVSWFERRRGLSIGILVGATTVGSALPHLFNALPLFPGPAGLPPWPDVLLAASASSLVGVAIVGLWVRPGPQLPPPSRFDARQVVLSFTDRPLRRANFGYLGHMWELYAMWTWAPLFVLQVFRAHGLDDVAARVVGFLIIAVGGIGCVVAGQLADRYGRTLVTSASLFVSGACALGAGFLGGAPWLLAGLCLVWGFAVVADSAQFSAAVSELCDPAFVGTALTTQTAAGFLLTLVTIRWVPSLAESLGWGAAFAVLAIGPVFGAVNMLALRFSPARSRLAGGRG